MGAYSTVFSRVNAAGGGALHFADYCRDYEFRQQPPIIVFYIKK